MRKCKVEECEGRHDSNGYCGMHANRVRRHGDPNYTPPRNSRNVQFVLDVVSSKSVRECINWPYGVNNYGYGQVSYKGQGGHAHALALKMKKGMPVENGMHAAHECGNRLCINPEHLKWKTPKENNDDKKIHGTWQEGAKVPTSILTESQAEEILARYIEGHKLSSIAKDYPVKLCTVHSIVYRRSWRHIDSRTAFKINNLRKESISKIRDKYIELNRAAGVLPYQKG